MEKLTKGHWGKKMSRSGWEKGLTCDNFNYRKNGNYSQSWMNK